MRLSPTLPVNRSSVRELTLDPSRSVPMRLACYTLLAFAVFQGVYVGLTRMGPEFIGAETGPVELAQPVLAIFAGFAFLYAATFSTNGKAGLSVCASLLFYAAAREQDFVFEGLFFDDAYKWLVGFPLFVFVIVTLRRNRLQLVSESIWLSQQTCVIVFAIAGIYLTTVCQLFDRPMFWSGISSVAEATAVKSMIEETSELFAYLLLAFSGVESLLIVFRPRELEAANHTTVETTIHSSAGSAQCDLDHDAIAIV